MFAPAEVIDFMYLSLCKVIIKQYSFRPTNASKLPTVLITLNLYLFHGYTIHLIISPAGEGFCEKVLYQAF